MDETRKTIQRAQTTIENAMTRENLTFNGRITRLAGEKAHFAMVAVCSDEPGGGEVRMVERLIRKLQARRAARSPKDAQGGR